MEGQTLPEEQVTVRRARSDDAEALTAIWCEMAAEHNAYDPERWHWAPDAAGCWRAWLLDCVSAGPMHVLVAADVADRPVGYLLFGLAENPPVFARRTAAPVYDVAVHSAWRRRGVGRRLMHAAMAEMRQMGAEEMRLSVAVSNEGAMRFYEGMGLRPTTHAMFRRL